MKYYNLKTQFGEYEVSIELGEYSYGGTYAIELITKEGEPFARITTNLPDYCLDKDEVFLDTNNCPWAETFVKANGLGTPLGWTGHSGWCDYPAYKLNLAKLKGGE